MCRNGLWRLFFYASCVTVVGAVSCPDGWSLYARTNSCYKLLANTVGWATANEVCEEAFGGHLAILKDEVEQQFVKATFLKDVGPPGVWLGARYYKKGRRSWVDGSELLIGQYSWKSGNPSTTPDTDDLPVELRQGCIAISTQPRFRSLLTDLACRRKCPYLCQRSAIEGQTTVLSLSHMIIIAAVVVFVIGVSVIVALVLYWRRHYGHVYEERTETSSVNSANEYTYLETTGSTTAKGCNQDARNAPDVISGTNDIADYCPEPDYATIGSVSYGFTTVKEENQRKSSLGGSSQEGTTGYLTPTSLRKATRKDAVCETRSESKQDTVSQSTQPMRKPLTYSRNPSTTGAGSLDLDRFSSSEHISTDSDIKSLHPNDRAMQRTLTQPNSDARQMDKKEGTRSSSGDRKRSLPGKNVGDSPRFDSSGYLAIDSD